MNTEDSLPRIAVLLDRVYLWSRWGMSGGRAVHGARRRKVWDRELPMPCRTAEWRQPCPV